MSEKYFIQYSSFYKSWFFFFFLSVIYFTSFGEQDKADINSLRWSAPVGLEPAYIRIGVAHSTTVLQTLSWFQGVSGL